MSPKNGFDLASLRPGEIAAGAASVLLLLAAFGYGTYAVAEHSRPASGVDPHRITERLSRTAPETVDQVRECDVPAGVVETCIFL